MNKFLILRYFEFCMIDTKSILDQIHDLQMLIMILYKMKVEISKSFQVREIITKLPPSWNDYRKNPLHRKDDITLEELQKHLRIEEESRFRDQNNNSHNFSKVNIV